MRKGSCSFSAWSWPVILVVINIGLFTRIRICGDESLLSFIFCILCHLLNKLYKLTEPCHIKRGLNAYENREGSDRTENMQSHLTELLLFTCQIYSPERSTKQKARAFLFEYTKLTYTSSLLFMMTQLILVYMQNVIPSAILYFRPEI